MLYNAIRKVDNVCVKNMLSRIKQYCINSVNNFTRHTKLKVVKFVDLHKNQNLSALVKVERKNRCKPSPFSQSLGFNLYNPSLKSFLLILSVFAVLFIFSHWVQVLAEFVLCKLGINYVFPLVGQDDNHYQNLIAIIAGIGGIVFALTIFIAESFRDLSTDRGRVLLRESYIWPLTVSVILSFLLLLWGDINYSIVIPIIAVALFALYSLAKIISTLLSKHKLVKKRGLLLKELVQQSIDFAIDERLADNILLSKLDGKEIKLQFHPFSFDNQNSLVCFKAEKLGVITGINIKKLKEFSEKLEKRANENGFAYEAQQEKTSDDFSVDAQVKDTPKQKALIQNNKRYIARKYHDVIDEKHSNLLCFDKELVKDDQSFISDLKDIFDQIFKIEAVESFAEEVRYELSNIKDQFTSAIKETKTGEVEELAKTYIVLAEGFLEQVLSCGGGYNYEQARKERTSWFSGWQEVRWLSSDLVDLFDQAVKTGDKEIIGTIAYVPISIAKRAIEKHDHYLFQEFIGLSERVYFYSKQTNDEQVKKFLSDRSWRYLKELCDYYIEAPLRKQDITVEELRSYKDFSIHLLFIFQNLLKASFDNKDLEAFQQFKSTTLKLFDSTYPDRYYDNSHNLEYELKQENLTPERRKILEENLALVKERSNVWSEIGNRRTQMLFGIASLVFDRLQKNPEDSVLKSFFNDIHNSLPNNIVEFTTIFQQVHSFETEDFWGWSWWESRPDEGVHTIQVLEKLEKFYAVKSLIILANTTDDTLLNLEIPTSRDFAYLVEGTRDLIKTLDDIKQNPDKWTFVLNSKATERLDKFRELLTSAEKRQKENEILEKRRKAPSIEKITKFKKDVIASYDKSVRAVPLFKFFNLYENNVSKKYNPEDKTRFGVNTVDDKAAFFDDWHVHYGDWGENYGRNIATGVDSEILDKIREKATKIKKGQFEETLKGLKNLEDIIIVGNRVSMMRFFDSTHIFMPYWHRDTPKVDVQGFYGQYKYQDKLIPVFEIFDNKSKTNIYIINKRTLGKLVQHSPINEDEDQNLIRDIFYFNIRAFSEDEALMNEFISKPPEWLKEIKEVEKQKEHLAERILIQIYVRFSIEWDKTPEIYVLETNEDSNVL